MFDPMLLYFIALCFLSTFQSPHPNFRSSAAADETPQIIHLVFFVPQTRIGAAELILLVGQTVHSILYI
jgi:hypothetical protein